MNDLGDTVFGMKRFIRKQEVKVNRHDTMNLIKYNTLSNTLSA